MSGRGHFEFVGVKKFYRLEDIVQRTNARKKDVIELALLSESLYRIGSIVLVNKARMDEFCQQMRIYNLDIKSVYVGPQEAANHLGVPIEFLYQVASRAKALYKIEGRFFVNVELVNNYFAKYRVTYKNDFDDIYQILGLKEEEENV